MRERSVQPELLPYLLDVSRRRREITDKRLYRVTGHNVHDHKIDDDDRQNDGDCPIQAAPVDSDPSSDLSRIASA